MLVKHALVVLVSEHVSEPAEAGSATMLVGTAQCSTILVQLKLVIEDVFGVFAPRAFQSPLIVCLKLQRKRTV